MTDLCHLNAAIIILYYTILTAEDMSTTPLKSLVSHDGSSSMPHVAGLNSVLLPLASTCCGRYLFVSYVDSGGHDDFITEVCDKSGRQQQHASCGWAQLHSAQRTWREVLHSACRQEPCRQTRTNQLHFTVLFYVTCGGVVAPSSVDFNHR